MRNPNTVQILRTAVATLTVFGALIATSSNAQTPPDQILDLPAGLACKDFDLRIEIRGGNQVVREYRDKNGNVVRLLSAGVGSQLTFINMSSEAKLSLMANGSVTHIGFNPDGSSTWSTTGHNVLILFPTDIPAGPSTTLNVGRVLFSVDTTGIFTVKKVSGRSMDICAILSA